MPKKVYISGPISGLEISVVRQRFDTAKKTLIEAGFTPVSPLENGLPLCASYAEHMARDIEMLSECQAVYMLKDWEKSNGCKVEIGVAIKQKKYIAFEQ